MMWEQIKANRVRSIVLVAVLGAVLVLIGWFLGLAFADNGIIGLVIALAVWGFMNLIAYFQGDSILLGVAGAQKIKP
jgi:heat shock protein HtpX